MKFNLNTVYLTISCFAFIILKNVSRLAQSNEESESEEDSTSTPDEATESSSESSPEEDGTAEQQPPIQQLYEK